MLWAWANKHGQDKGSEADGEGNENKDESEDGMSRSGVMDDDRDSGGNHSKAEAVQPEMTMVMEAPSTVAQAGEVGGLIKSPERLRELTACDTVWSMQGSLTLRKYFADGRGQDEASNDGKDEESKGQDDEPVEPDEEGEYDWGAEAKKPAKEKGVQHEWWDSLLPYNVERSRYREMIWEQKGGRWYGRWRWIEWQDSAGQRMPWVQWVQQMRQSRMQWMLLKRWVQRMQRMRWTQRMQWVLEMLVRYTRWAWRGSELKVLVMYALSTMWTAAEAAAVLAVLAGWITLDTAVTLHVLSLPFQSVMVYVLTMSPWIEQLEWEVMSLCLQVLEPFDRTATWRWLLCKAWLLWAQRPSLFPDWVVYWDDTFLAWWASVRPVRHAHNAAGVPQEVLLQVIKCLAQDAPRNGEVHHDEQRRVPVEGLGNIALVCNAWYIIIAPTLYSGLVFRDKVLKYPLPRSSAQHTRQITIRSNQPFGTSAKIAALVPCPSSVERLIWEVPEAPERPARVRRRNGAVRPLPLNSQRAPLDLSVREAPFPPMVAISHAHSHRPYSNLTRLHFSRCTFFPSADLLLLLATFPALEKVDLRQVSVARVSETAIRPKRGVSIRIRDIYVGVRCTPSGLPFVTHCWTWPCKPSKHQAPSFHGLILAEQRLIARVIGLAVKAGDASQHSLNVMDNNSRTCKQHVSLRYDGLVSARC